MGTGADRPVTVGEGGLGAGDELEQTSPALLRLPPRATECVGVGGIGALGLANIHPIVVPTIDDTLS